MKHASLALCLVLGTPALTAQEPPAVNGDAVDATQRKDALQRHILHLVDGRVLRAKAREVEGGWEVQRRSARDLYLVPAASVKRAAREKDVLHQARDLEKTLAKGDDVRRVAYGEWLFSQGLYEEGLDELDLVLHRDGDQPDALALLRRDPPPVKLPPLDVDPAKAEKALDEFLRTAAGARPSVKEIMVNLLGERRDAMDVRRTLKEDLADTSVRRRGFAALAMRRLYPGTEIRTMLQRAILDGSENVRREASYALRDAEEPAVVLPFLKALGSDYSSVRKNAAEALGAMGYPHAVEPLMTHLVNLSSAQSGGYVSPRSHIFVGKQIAYIQDYDVEVAQFEAIADPQINTLTEGSVLDVRVHSINQYEIGTEKASIRKSLASLTGASPGHTTSAWRSWWAKHGDEWTMDEPSGPPSSPTSPGR